MYFFRAPEIFLIERLIVYICHYDTLGKFIVSLQSDTFGVLVTPHRFGIYLSLGAAKSNNFYFY